jgi:hypothetical protein
MASENIPDSAIQTFPCCGALTFSEHRENVDARKCSKKAWIAFLVASDEQREREALAKATIAAAVAK